MTLLFDQNISFQVAKKLQHTFPGSKHLSDLRLERFNDSEIWSYARAHDLCIVTFDSDFIELSALKGFPPKIIWLRTGNTSTQAIIDRLSQDHAVILDFLNDQNIAFLEIK